MESRNPDWQAYTQSKVESNAFLRYLGVEIQLGEPGLVEAEVSFQPILGQQDGLLHGGVAATLCDMVCGFASYSVVGAGDKVFTVEIKVSYYRKGAADRYFARGRVLKAGRNFHFCEGEVFTRSGGEETIIAKATTTMAVRLNESVQ